MKMIHALILVDRDARRFAGRCVAEMIKSGCDGETMRAHQIPKSVFYAVLGGQRAYNTTVEAMAEECVGYYRKLCLYRTTP